MATKAGRVEISDIRQGKTLWYPEFNEFTDTWSVRPALVMHGARKMYGEKPGWTFWDSYVRGRILYPEYFPLNEKGEPCLDKLFISRSAALRYIKRRQSNRIEALCEDRRIFVRGSKLLRLNASYGNEKLEDQAPNTFTSSQVGYYCGLYSQLGQHYPGRVRPQQLLELTQ
jgi:hypothetical protein